ncbi:MAG: winged helix-turn-helix transcriptional regulator [Aquificae bacterium]|nr:winged helix-turn-helix transcriptional regulator [Aquificota bacterium]
MTKDLKATDRELKKNFEALNELFSEDEIEILAAMLKALAHPTRLKIAFLLYTAQNHKVCVSNIVDLLGLPQPNISQHLFVLKSAGILSCQREKNFVCYQLNEGLPEKIIKTIIEDKGCLKDLGKED